MIHQTTPEALQLLFDGQQALSVVEQAGVRVDKSYLDGAILDAEKQIADLEAQMKSDKVWKVWKKRFGDKAKMGSRPQLAKVVFEDFGYESKDQTATGRAKADKNALEGVDLDFVKSFVKLENLKRDKTYYLEGIRREIVTHDDGLWYYHPSFNLNTARSMRSSSGSNKDDRPTRDLNWQNIPARDPVRSKMVRTAFIPRPGCDFAECDYGQIEIAVPAMITGDKELNRYYTDLSTDMHRDQACAVFKLSKDELTKAVRTSVKTWFVFASFYGSAWYNCASKLWEDIDRVGLKTTAGIPLKEHLRSKGITELGFKPIVSDRNQSAQDLRYRLEGHTFGAHVQDCHDRLWKRFRGYAEWRDKTYEQYQRDGGLLAVTGFAANGVFTRNEILNTPIQGPAFHCLLWSIIELLKRLKKYKLKTLILGETHDSHQSDVPKKERNVWFDLVEQTMTEDIRKAWRWLTLRPKIEIEVAPESKSWYYKKPVIRQENGIWA